MGVFNNLLPIPIPGLSRGETSPADALAKSGGKNTGSSTSPAVTSDSNGNRKKAFRGISPGAAGRRLMEQAATWSSRATTLRGDASVAPSTFSQSSNNLSEGIFVTREVEVSYEAQAGNPGSTKRQDGEVIGGVNERGQHNTFIRSEASSGTPNANTTRRKLLKRALPGAMERLFEKWTPRPSIMLPRGRQTNGKEYGSVIQDLENLQGAKKAKTESIAFADAPLPSLLKLEKWQHIESGETAGKWADSISELFKSEAKPSEPDIASKDVTPLNSKAADGTVERQDTQQAHKPAPEKEGDNVGVASKTATNATKDAAAPEIYGTGMLEDVKLGERGAPASGSRFLENL